MPEPRLPDAVWNAIDAHDLLGSGGRAVVAVSGGPDSTALLFALADRRPDARSGLELAVAHYHHGTEPADEMRDLVATHADRLGLPLFTDGKNIAALATQSGDSFEHTARTRRYAFLASTARQWGATTVLTAHTRDDQDETILMAMLEGTGLAGLGMPWHRPIDTATPRITLARPLLDVPLASVREYVAARELATVDDPSNLDRTRLRARVRFELLPYLEAHGNAGVRAHLRALADEARALTALQLEQVTSVLRRAWRRTATPPRLELEVLRSAAPTLQRAVVHAVLRDLAISPRQVSRAGIEAVCTLIDNVAGKALDLPGGWTAKRKGANAIVFRHADHLDRGTTFLIKRTPVPEQVTVADPGETPFSTFGHAFTLALEHRHVSREEFAAYRERNDPGEILVQTAFSFTKPLSIRRIALPTKFTPLGAPGKQKLKKFLASRGIAAAYRPLWPVLCDSFGRIVWVVGLELAHDARVVSFGPDAPVAHRVRLIEQDAGTFPARLGPRS